MRGHEGQVLSVLLPRHFIATGSGLLIHLQVGVAQSLRRNVV